LVLLPDAVAAAILATTGAAPVGGSRPRGGRGCGKVPRVTTDDRLVRAKDLYERSVFHGEPDALAEADEILDAVEADLALARGRIRHARYLAERQEVPEEKDLFERAASLYRALGDLRGEAEALFWIGTFEQVVRGDDTAALPALLRAHDLAAEVGDRLTLSYVVRHLGFVDMAAGDLAAARGRLEESVALRREIGFLPGVAAGLLALAELAAEDGRADEARALLDEAAATARTSGAGGIMRWIEAVRESVEKGDTPEPEPDPGAGAAAPPGPHRQDVPESRA
jgi:tetratricopeptide (TPR) repeat protein